MKHTLNRLSKVLLLFALVVPLFATTLTAQDAEKKTLTLTTKSEDAKRHFWMGMHDAENVFLDRAATHFAAAVEADPDLAIAQIMHDVFVPGLTQSERLAKIDMSLGRVATSSTAELLFATGMREQRGGNQENALALTSAAAELVPDDPHVAFYRASVVGGGQSARIEALRDLTERFPDMSSTYNSLAYALWASGDKAGARENVAKYVELEPKHPNSHDSYAEILQFSGLFSQAAMHYRKSIELDPNYFAGYAGLSETQVLSGDAAGARKSLEDARAHASNETAVANLNRAVANTYFMEGNGKKGLSTLLEAAAALEKTTNKNLAAQSHRELAVAEALYGNKANIAGHVTRAMELQSGNAAGNNAWAAIAYGLAGDVAAARTATRAFEKATDGNGFTKTLDGIVLVASGEHAAAEKKLIESGLNDDWAKVFMIRCQKEMGHMPEAASLTQELRGDSQFTAYNLQYTLSRGTLSDDGAGHIRAGLKNSK
jgi:tetratricopeptide (TPR) repeat protein